MKDNPLIASLLIGMIVVLLIAGVSLLVKMNNLSNLQRKEAAMRISSDKKAEELESENERLKKNVEVLHEQMKKLKFETEKAQMLKEKLEESLTEELIKNKPGEE